MYLGQGREERIRPIARYRPRRERRHQKHSRSVVVIFIEGYEHLCNAPITDGHGLQTAKPENNRLPNYETVVS